MPAMKYLIPIIFFFSATLLAQENKQVITYEDLGRGPEITSFEFIPGGTHVIVSEKNGKNECSFLTNFSTMQSDTLGVVDKWEASDADNIIFLGGGKATAKPLVRYHIKSKQYDTLQPECVGFELIGSYGCMLTYPKKGNADKHINYKLIAFNPKKSVHLPDTLSAFSLSGNKSLMFIASWSKGKTKLFMVDVKNGQVKDLASIEDVTGQLVSSNNGSLLAATGQRKITLLNVANGIVTSTQIPEGWHIISVPKPTFSGEDGSLLVYLEHDSGREVIAKDDGIDIWDWRDVTLVSAEARKAERRQSLKYLWFIPRSGKPRQIENDTLLRAHPVGDGSRYVMAMVEYPYLFQRSWESGKVSDYYLVDLLEGKTSLLRKASTFYVNSSPGGKYLYWFGNDSSWYTFNLSTRRHAKVNTGETDQFFNILFDEPSNPGPYAAEGWTTHDEGIILKGFYDLYLVDPEGIKPAVCLTNGYGRRHNIQFRVSEYDKRRGFRMGENITVEGFSLSTKQSGLFRVTLGKSVNPVSLVWGDFKVDGVKVSEDGKRILYTAQTYNTYPDIMLLQDGEKPQRITRVGDYYSRYAVGSDRLVAWMNPEGGKLQGILYLPDSTIWKKPYPVVVNVYERKSDNLNLFIKPEYSQAEINVPYYVSNGYAVFIPDIVFRIGDPGESSYQCVSSGLSYIFAHFSNLDSAHVGIQGHSWGAYQTAYLVTRLNSFNAAVAMAPVSDMVSAYGGLRPGMGNSRMFQYESGQSRIGETLWQNPGAYIKHSTVLYADRITTPLLIIANDGDGAVPWEQGMELFLAMRRLGKPCWMVNYKGDAHVLNREQNKQDFTRRMMEFFEYYLKGKHAPTWISRNTND